MTSSKEIVVDEKKFYLWCTMGMEMGMIVSVQVFLRDLLGECDRRTVWTGECLCLSHDLYFPLKAQRVEF